jgi:hypothetical protein
MPGKDKELPAIGSIMGLLTPLDEGERSRVLEYVLKRLEMATIRTPGINQREIPNSAMASSTNRTVTDIRTLTAEKQPRSVNEMVALVAYYLSELSSDGERSDTVNADTIRRYFKMAGFPLPSVLRNVLPNASAAGYLENVSRGEYRLNPVGYNLVVHGLPRSSGPGPVAPTSRPARRTTGKKIRKTKRRGH